MHKSFIHILDFYKLLQIGMAILAACWIFAGCRTAAHLDAHSDEVQSAVGQLAGLPLRHVAVALPGHQGDDFESSLLAPQHVESFQNAGLYTPAWQPGSQEFANLAFALYAFDVSTATTSFHELQLSWDSEQSPAPSNLWLGLADWQAGRWRWFQPVDLSRLPYDAAVFEETGQLLAVVVVTGTMPCLLHTIAIGACDTWAHSWGNDDYDTSNGAAADADGNIYAIGTTYDHSGGERGASLIKYNPAGLLQWIRHYQYSVDYEFFDIVTDAAGSVYIVGEACWAQDYYGDVLLLKFSPAGELLWQKVWASLDADISEYGRTITVDNAGNIVLYALTYDISSTKYIDIIKIDNSGQVCFSKQCGISSDQCCDLKTDALGNIYLVGFCNDGNDSLVLKLNADGITQWARKWTPSRYDGLYALVVSEEGTMYITGSRSISDAEEVTLLFSLDTNGNVLYGRSWRDGQDNSARDIAKSSDGDLHIATGCFRGPQGRDIYHVHISAAGDLISAQRWAAESAQTATEILALPDNKLFFSAVGYDASGSWQPITDSIYEELTVELTDVTMPTSDITGEIHDVTGKLLNYGGVIDTGGGATDLVMIKAVP